MVLRNVDHCRAGLLVFAVFAIASGLRAQPPDIGIKDEPPGGAANPPRVVLSPPAHTAIRIGGARISVAYSAPSRRKRVIFGGLEPYNKVWRAGANDATALHADADLNLEGLLIPKGDYTLFVWLDEKQWLLIVNKQTGQTGLQYDAARDLGRVPMAMSHPAKTIEKFRITLSKTGPSGGRLEMAWEDTIASVGFTVNGLMSNSGNF